MVRWPYSSYHSFFNLCIIIISHTIFLLIFYFFSFPYMHTQFFLSDPPLFLSSFNIFISLTLPPCFHLSLSVSVAPQLTVLETSITVVEGSEVTLSCSATGHPTPTVTWQRNGGEVPSDSTPNLSSEGGEGAGSLTISPVRGEDGGDWECVGTNIVTSNHLPISLTVLSESIIAGAHSQ